MDISSSNHEFSVFRHFPTFLPTINFQPANGHVFWHLLMVVNRWDQAVKCHIVPQQMITETIDLEPGWKRKRLWDSDDNQVNQHVAWTSRDILLQGVIQLVFPRKKRPESGSQRPQVQRQRSPKDLKALNEGGLCFLALTCFDWYSQNPQNYESCNIMKHLPENLPLHWLSF